MKHFSKDSSASYFALDSAFDSVHGVIELADANGKRANSTIRELINSPMMQRLRRIRQLGYVSHYYTSADHTRYAHALGTMHVMRKLCSRLQHTFRNELHETLYKCFPKTFNLGEEMTESLVQHLLVAGLLQDVGELPYNHSTEHVYSPSEELKDAVSNMVGFPVNDWNNKDIFTIASIDEHRVLLTELDFTFLVFLITGKHPFSINDISPLIPLRHMVDGAVDADRLDYVYRDTLHTIGVHNIPNAVIESLVYYDADGPVFSDPGPVLNFLTTRAFIWMTVFFSPQHRFRTLLLIRILQGILEKQDCARQFFPNPNAELSIEDFKELDDLTLNRKLTEFDQSKAVRRLSRNARKALDLLIGEPLDYDCFWIEPSQGKIQTSHEEVLPDDLFFDTATDYEEYELYEPGSIRILSDRFRYLENPLPLEQCCGPFNPIFQGSQSVVPMPGRALVFIPRDRPSGTWNNFQKAIEENRAYNLLMQYDLFARTPFPYDTREKKGFLEPKIFISYAFSDRQIVKKIAIALFERARRFFLFARDFQGVGGTPNANSVAAVEEAGAILIVASENYVRRYTDEPDGAIAGEIFATIKRVKSEKVPVVVLSVDEHTKIEGRLPWSQLGYQGTPFVGRPLRNAKQREIVEVVDEMLRVIDPP